MSGERAGEREKDNDGDIAEEGGEWDNGEMHGIGNGFGRI